MKTSPTFGILFKPSLATLSRKQAADLLRDHRNTILLDHKPRRLGAGSILLGLFILHTR